MRDVFATLCQYVVHATRVRVAEFCESLKSNAIEACTMHARQCAHKTHRQPTQLLSAIDGLERGRTASEEDKAEVERLVQQLEKVNPNPSSLAAPEINGKWRLVYTTSTSILGTNRPAFVRPGGPIFQFIDAEKLKARNQETWPFFNSVTASLTPASKSKVAVKFETFKLLNLIPVKAPESATGELDTTYVDSEMRISRGDKGNLFVLLMDDPAARL